jgi:hypothetical protein
VRSSSSSRRVAESLIVHFLPVSGQQRMKERKKERYNIKREATRLLLLYTFDGQQRIIKKK